MVITEQDVGRYVWHYNPDTNEGALGRIKSVTINEVFVVFGSLADLKDFANRPAGSTPTERLTWSNKAKD